MEDPAEFNRNLIAEIKEEMAATGLPFEDLFFERLSGSLEAEGEIETADRVSFEGAASGKTLRVDGVGGDPRDAVGVLSVIVYEPFPNGDTATINAADAKKTFGHLINFVAAARRAEFRNGLHPETPEAGLANMISAATVPRRLTVAPAANTSRGAVRVSLADTPDRKRSSPFLRVCGSAKTAVADSMRLARRMFRHLLGIGIAPLGHYAPTLPHSFGRALIRINVGACFQRYTLLKMPSIPDRRR